jgi:ParB family chromosome partitioning protein
MAMRCELAKRPDLALAIIVHDLALAAFYETWEHDEKLTEIALKLTDVASFIENGDGDKAVSERRAVLEDWASRLPSDVKELWPWVIAQEESALLELLAILVAGTINLVTSRGEKPSARATSRDRLTTALTLDMTRWWRADARFLSRISKAAILAALAEGVSPKIAASLSQGTKGDLVPAAERKLAKSSWLPVVLRTPKPSDDQVDVAEAEIGHDQPERVE